MRVLIVGLIGLGLMGCCCRDQALGLESYPETDALRVVGNSRFLPPAFPEIEIAAGNLLGALPESLQAELGKPEKKLRREPQTDAPQWWLYPQRGLELRVRATQLSESNATPPLQVDLIRFTTPGAGQVGGLRVGASEAALRANLGPPTIFPDAPEMFSYFSEALRFQVQQGRVCAIDIARLADRPPVMSPPRPKFWIAPIDGDSSRDLRLDLAPQIRGLFQNIPIYQLVDSPAAADYAVYVYIDRPQTVEIWKSEEKEKSDKAKEKEKSDKAKEKKKVFYLDSLSTCEVHVSVAAPVSGVCLPGFYRRAIVGEKHETIYKDDKNYGPAVYQQQAAEAAIAAFAPALYKIVSCRGPVMHIDYGKNRILINLGRDQGIAKEGIEFDFWVDGRRLDTDKDRSKSFGKVVAVGPNYCEVQLIKKVTKWFSNRWEDDWGALNIVPDPGSGRVEAVTRLPHQLVN
jgi:hypothetical protein